MLATLATWCRMGMFPGRARFAIVLGGPRASTLCFDGHKLDPRTSLHLPWVCGGNCRAVVEGCLSASFLRRRYPIRGNQGNHRLLEGHPDHRVGPPLLVCRVRVVFDYRPSAIAVLLVLQVDLRPFAFGVLLLRQAGFGRMRSIRRPLRIASSMLLKIGADRSRRCRRG